MPAQPFRFDFHGNVAFAMGHAGDIVTLSLSQSHATASFRLTPYAARRMAEALIGAADFAERATPVVIAPPVAA